MIIVLSILINFTFGIQISNAQNKKKKKIFLSIGVAINLLILFTFKYLGFFIENLNWFIEIFDGELLHVKKIALPLGISFYTFQSISYLVDTFRKHTTVQRNLINLALYVSFYPQLIAGPIVRYHYINKQLKNRDNTIDKLLSGIQRFILGLARKVFSKV